MEAKTKKNVYICEIPPRNPNVPLTSVLKTSGFEHKTAKQIYDDYNSMSQMEPFQSTEENEEEE